MNGRKNRTTNYCLVFTFLASFLCVLLIGGISSIEAAETMLAQLGSDEKAREAELMEERREAEMRAKREAQEKARAKREEASRLAALDAAKKVIGDLNEYIELSHKFYEGITARQAKLAINDVSPLDE